MRKQFLAGYLLTAALLVWSLASRNFEFLLYAVTVLALVGILHTGDRRFGFDGYVLWGFDLWIVLHIFGGLLPVGDGVLYSLVLVDIVGAPYDILKYDQVVHAYCYFIAALLVWRIVISFSRPGHFVAPAIVTVLAASGVGGLNEIVEFLATVLIADTNVGGYHNTAIDIVANLLGACAAVPFFRRPAAGPPPGG